MTDDHGVKLTGGRMTQNVVRVADTVRRPPSPASPFVAELLGLLAKNGFDGAPRYLGLDDEGMDTFTFVPGEVPARFRQWEDAQIAAAGALLRGLHDATRGSELAGRRPLVCHHDPGPNNVVFQDGSPVAFIDFDEAAPGAAFEDWGYMAWTWCVSSKVPERQVAVQAAQVRVLADSYDLDGAERVVAVDAILERQLRNVRFWAEGMQALRDNPASAMATPEQLSDRIAWSRREHDHTVAHRAVFEAALR
jgi:Ser/Thr protein kinase RdoA (MazF antagonist)